MNTQWLARQAGKKSLRALAMRTGSFSGRQRGPAGKQAFMTLSMRTARRQRGPAGKQALIGLGTRTARQRGLAVDAAVSCLTEGGRRAKQAYTNAAGNTVFRHEGNRTFIDRFYGDQWHTYGPYPMS